MPKPPHWTAPVANLEMKVQVRHSIELQITPGREAGKWRAKKPKRAKNIHCYPEGCAAPSVVPCQCNTRGSLSKLKGAPPQRKINVTCKSPVGDISVVTLIRTDTTLDHSQKAEKVCYWMAQLLCLAPVAASKVFFRFSGA